MEKTINLIKRCKKNGIDLYVEDKKLKYRCLGTEIPEDILKELKNNRESIIIYLNSEMENLEGNYIDSKFPLSKIQSSYLIGREDIYSYGNVSCHIYQEFSYEYLDIKKVEKIWNDLINKHDMLRAIIHSDGYQEILKQVSTYKVIKGDKLLIRKKLENKIYELETWPMFDIGVSQEEGKSFFHLSMDLMIVDWSSIWQLLLEFEELYFKGVSSFYNSSMNFRDYIMLTRSEKYSLKYIQDKSYWNSIIKDIKPAPRLPISIESNKEPNKKIKPTFSRRSLKINNKTWEKIKYISKKYAVTPTATILTIYSEVLKAFSLNKEFSINITLFNKIDVGEDISNLVGDFTNTSIVSVEDSRLNFIDSVRTINKNIFNSIDHSLYSGVEIMRDLAKDNSEKEFLLPYVYTSAIGLTKKDIMGNYEYGISQTPQVFIDCQAMDITSGLQINWDVRDGIFSTELIDVIFQTFNDTLETIADEEKWNEPLNISLSKNSVIEKNNIEKIEHNNLETIEKILMDQKEINNVNVTIDKNSLKRKVNIIAEIKKIDLKENLRKNAKNFENVLVNNEENLLSVNYIKIKKEMDLLCLHSILNCMVDINYFEEKDNLLKKCTNPLNRILDKHKWVLPRWENVLEEYEIIIRTEKKSEYFSKLRIEEAEISERFKILSEEYKECFGDNTFISYLESNVINLKNLLLGNKDPIELLYPEGSEKYVNTIYNNSIESKFINDHFNEIVNECIDNFNKKNRLRILEVGGGIGATTKGILRNLGTINYEYHFTDNNKYFVSLGKNFFQNNKNIHVYHFDIDRDPVEQGLEPNYFDIIIGAYVLENAKNLKKSIKYLKKVISPNGYLILSETIKNEPWILSSQVFMMEEPDDRLRNNKFFLNLKEWQSILYSKNRSELIRVFPDSLDLLDILGLTLLVTQCKMDLASIDRDKIKRYIESVLPLNTSLGEVIFVEDINDYRKSNYMKYYKSKLLDEKPLEKSKTNDIKILDNKKYNSIEQKVIEVCSKFLDSIEIDNDVDFYEYGADSLTLSRIASELEKELDSGLSFEKILKELVSNPRINSIVNVFYNVNNENKENLQPKTKFIYSKKYKQLKNEDQRLRVLLHGAFGNLENFDFLANELLMQEEGNVLLLGVADIEEYLKINNKNLVLKLADTYFDEIIKESPENVQIIGYSFSGVVAIEVARKLLENGVYVENLSIIESGILTDFNYDELLLEIIFMQVYDIYLEDLGIKEDKIFDYMFKNTENIENVLTVNNMKRFLTNDDCVIINKLLSMKKKERLEYYYELALKKRTEPLSLKSFLEMYEIFEHSFKAQKYKPNLYFGDIDYYIAKDNKEAYKYFGILKHSLENVLIGDIKEHLIPGNHFTSVQDSANAKALSTMLTLDKLSY